VGRAWNPVWDGDGCVGHGQGSRFVSDEESSAQHSTGFWDGERVMLKGAKCFTQEYALGDLGRQCLYNQRRDCSHPLRRCKKPGMGLFSAMRLTFQRVDSLASG
jgi:hypothetical protein